MNTPPLTDAAWRALSARLGLIALLWAGAVTLAAAEGWLSRLWQPSVAGLVGLGIAVPTVAYFASGRLQSWAAATGLRAMTAFHIWRIPAALAFFWFGAQGTLPPLFWIPAGIGDLIAGLWALHVVRKPDASPSDYRRMHRFGFIDFVVAVGSGLAHTLLLDPRMAPIALLPLALIPLFGVGLSGASHLVAFDLLRRAR